MAFAAVLTARGYYIILRRFCQGLLKIFLQGAATGGVVFPLCRLPTPAFGLLPCPSPPPGRRRQVEPATKTATPQPAAANARRASEAGQATPEHAPRLAFSWQVLQVPQVVQCRGAGGGAPGEINFESPPSPPGKGVGGIGAKKKVKAGDSRRQRRQATTGHHSGRDSRCRREPPSKNKPTRKLSTIY